MLKLLKTIFTTIFTGELLYPTLAAVGLSVLVAVATTWAVHSRRHWFLRTAVVGAALATALLVPGYDFVLIFFTQALLAWLVLTLVKIWRIRAARRTSPQATQDPPCPRTRLRFTLTDLLLMFVVISGVLAVAVQVPKSIWAEWKWIGLFGLGFAGFSLGLMDMAILGTGKAQLGSMPAGKLHKKKRKRIGLLVRAFFFCQCLFLLLIVWPAVAIFHVAIHPRPLPAGVLPDPNGYDDLLRAGSSLARITVPDAEKATPAQLKKFLAASRQILTTARRGLSRDCRVPLTYTQADMNRDPGQVFRDLGRAFLAEGRLAELEGRRAEALQSYLDVIHLGKAAASGGLDVDTFVGWWLEGIGVQGLASLTEALPTDQCRKAIQALLAFDAKREPVKDILDRDALWLEHAFGGRALKAVGFSPFEDGLSDAVEQAAKRNQAKMRLLICELALRQYRLANGTDPAKLADLVPQCLSALPIDPYSKKPLIYRQTTSGYQLYSVGPDGVDDGGKPMEKQLSTDVWPGDLHVHEPALDGPKTAGPGPDAPKTPSRPGSTPDEP